MKKTLTFWFEVIGEDSDLCGEEFFVQVDGGKDEAYAYAHELFPNVRLKCYGRVSNFEAECMGLDTY